MIRPIMGLFVVVSVVLGAIACGCGGPSTTELATDAQGNPLTADDVYSAAEKGDIDTIIVALENGTLDVNSQDAQGRTLLHHAVMGNQLDMVYSLIEEYQADPSVADKDSRTPLDYAVDAGDPSLITMLERATG